MQPISSGTTGTPHLPRPPRKEAAGDSGRLPSLSPIHVPVPEAERDFVDQALADPKFGAKNYYLLERFWGYDLDRPSPPWPTWTPPPPPDQAPPDPKLLPLARTYDSILASTSTSGPTMSLQVAGSGHEITVVGARPQELARLQNAIEAIPEADRGFLEGLKTVYVGDFAVLQNSNGSVSDTTSSANDLASGSMLLNRRRLNRQSAALPSDATADQRQAARSADETSWKDEIGDEFTQFRHLAQARTYDQATEQARKAGPVQQLAFEGLPGGLTLVGAHPDEIDQVRRAIDAIPPNDRGFLQNLKTLFITDVPVFKGQDGELSTSTTGVSNRDGTMLLNRHQLNYFRNHLKPDATPADIQKATDKDQWDWMNCLDHELCHFEDNAQPSPLSTAADSPLGHGVWYTNYSWETQDPREDAAEGFALLAQKRWDTLHHVVRPASRS